MHFPHTHRDSDTLQQVRAALPAEVRVTSLTHRLFGRLVQASGFKRWKGELLLVITLPDGCPGTVPAAATDILGTPGVRSPGGSTSLSVGGVRGAFTGGSGRLACRRRAAAKGR